jgi:hypothetical protein
MANPITWDNTGERLYATGLDRGVLYVPNASGVYDTGFAWNGLTGVSEAPSGAEATKQYADNGIYMTLTSIEELGATLEAFTYPDEFAQFDGIIETAPGVNVGQQSRGTFGLCYRTLIGNDLLDESYGYLIHLMYGCQATPSEKSYATLNESPEALTLSWEIMTTPHSVENNKPTSLVTIDSTKVDAGDLASLEVILYGLGPIEPALPTPDEVTALFTIAI